MVARLTAVERVSDQHEVRLNVREKNEDHILQSIADLRNLLHTQGVRLALIFGGINVIVVGVGLLIVFAKIMKALNQIGG